EPEGDVERIEDEVARGGIEIAELGGEPSGEALTQELAQLGDTQPHGRRDAADPLGEMPYRQPYLEQLRPVGHQKLNAARQGRRHIDWPVGLEGPTDRKVEGCCVEIGEIGEVLKQGAARDAGNG